MSVPPEAVQAARMALYGLPISTYTWEQLADVALEAAAPLIRQAARLDLTEGAIEAASAELVSQTVKAAVANERDRIAQLAEQLGAYYGCYVGIEGSNGTTVTSGLRPFAGLIRKEENT